MAKQRVSAEQKRRDAQVKGLMDALFDRDDLTVPFACVERAVFDVVELDCPNGHKTRAEELIPAAVKRAQECAAHTTEWDWKSNSDEILGELNRVLNPRGLKVQETNDGCDSVVFEFVPIDWRDLEQSE